MGVGVGVGVAEDLWEPEAADTRAASWGQSALPRRSQPCALALCSLLTAGAIHIVDAALPFCSVAPSFLLPTRCHRSS